MAEWTQIPDATFDIDRPILGSTHLAIVRNFEAMAEGANNAPRVQGSGKSANLIAEAEITSSVTSVEITDIEPHTCIRIGTKAGITFSSSGAVQIFASENNGANWRLVFSGSITSGSGRSVECEIRSTKRSVFAVGGATNVGFVDFGDVFSFGFSNDIPNGINAVRIVSSAGNMTAGTFEVYGVEREIEA